MIFRAFIYWGILQIFLLPGKKGMVQGQDVIDVTADCVIQHNKYRTGNLKDHPLPAVSADSTITQHAIEFMERRFLTNCEPFEHNEEGDYGENLYMGTSGDCERAVRLWYNEIKDYDYYGTNEGKVVGHFTQVMWEDSVRIGCAQQRNCPSLNQLVCNYDPPGNYINRKPFSEDVWEELQGLNTDDDTNTGGDDTNTGGDTTTTSSIKEYYRVSENTFIFLFIYILSIYIYNIGGPQY